MQFSRITYRDGLPNQLGASLNLFQQEVVILIFIISLNNKSPAHFSQNVPANIQHSVIVIYLGESIEE